MSSEEYIDQCKAALATQTIHTANVENTLRQYGQTIVSLGFVGIAALWIQLWDRIGDGFLLWSGALILISAAIFVGLEAVMLHTNIAATSHKKILLGELAQAVLSNDIEKITPVIKEIYSEEQEEGIAQVIFRNVSICSGLLGATVLVVGIIWEAVSKL